MGKFLRARTIGALTTAVSLFTLGLHAVPPAGADPVDPATDAIRTAISGDGGYAAFVDGLAGVGAFGQQVSGLTLVPGNDDALKLKDLMSGALAEATDWSTANSVDALANALKATDKDYSGDPPATAPFTPRHITFGATASKNNGIDTLDVTATVTRTVPTGIRLATATKPFDFSSDAGLKAKLTFVTHFLVDTDGATAWLEANPTTTLDVNAGVDKFDDVDAAIGILGVTLDKGPDDDLGKYNELAHLNATVRDPNNDGQLSVGQNSELGASGAPAGLTTAAINKPGGGTLDGRLHIVPKQSSVVTNLPGAQVNVTVSASDLGQAGPTADYLDHALDAVAAFETLTPFDLAQGVAQLSATLTELQKSRPKDSTVDVDLPFLHGTVADIVPANEALQQFLADHVTPSAQPGLPSEVDFASVQKFLDELAAEKGPKGSTVYGVKITDAGFDDTDPAHPALKFTIGIHRDASDQSADVLADILSGGPANVTYHDTSVDSDKDWDQLAADDSTGTIKAVVENLAGRQIIAGGHTAVIKKVTGKTITLDSAPFGDKPPTSLWTNGTPSNGTDKPGYTISAGDPKTGNVELGNTLLDKAHLRDANAVRPQATITPAYDATLPIVLDLEPAKTGHDCVTVFNAPADCPYKATTGKDGSGPSYVVSELPLRADRVRLTTGGSVLTATSKLTTPVDITAPVGYVPVHVTGTVDFKPTATNLTSLTLKTPTGMTSPVPLGGIFNTARDKPDDVVTGLTAPTGHAHAALKFDVVGDPTFFHTDKTSGSTDLDVDAPSASAVSVPDTTGDLAKLAVLDVKPGQNDALFGVLLADLNALSSQLRSPVANNDFGTRIPLVGTSFGQLLADGEQHAGADVTYTTTTKYLKLTDKARTFKDESSKGRRVTIGSAEFVVNDIDPSDEHTLRLVTVPATKPADGTAYRIGDELQWGVDALTAAPPTDLAVFLDTLTTRLGSTSSVSFTVDNSATPAVMHLTVDWKRAFKTRAPAGIHLTLPASKDVDVLGNTTDGVVDIDASGETIAKLNIQMDSNGVGDPTKYLTVDPASSRFAHATVSTPSKALGAAVGSLQVQLGNTGDDPGMSIKGDLSVLADATNAGTTPLSLSDWASKLKGTKFNDQTAAQTCSGVTSTADMSLCASIPLHKKGDAATLDTMVVRLPKTATSLADAVALSPAFGGGDRINALPGLDGALQANTISFGPLADGINKYIDNAKDALDLASAGGKVPLIGDDLQAGKDFLSDIQSKLNSGVGGVSGYSTFGDIQQKLKDIFTTGVAKDYSKSTPTVDGQCAGVPIPAPTGVDFAVNKPAATTADTDYAYKVLAVDAGGAATALSAASPTRKNAAVLVVNVTYNRVTWSKSKHASGYQVYRSTAGSADFKLVGTTTTDLFFNDANNTPGGAPPAAGNPTYSGPCDPSDPASYVTSVTLVAQLGSQGAIDKDNGCKDVSDTNKCLTADLPLDLGLPGISLHATKDPTDGTVSTAGIHAKLGWALTLAVTLDKTKGVLIETGKGTQPELQVGAAIHVDNLSASLAFLNINLKNTDPANSNQLAALFTVDLGCPGCDAAKQLPLTKLLSTDPASLFTPNIQAKVGIHFDIDTNIDPSIPGVSAKFKFEGDWNGATPTQFNIAALEFDQVSIDPGSFLKTTIKPIFDDIVNTLKPVQPILDTISAPIPVLSDLSHLVGGGDITIITLAQAFGFGDSSVQDVVSVVQTVTKIASALSSAAGSGINLGDFKLVSDKAKSTTASPDVADSLIDPAANPSSVVDDLNGDFGSSGDPKLSDAESGPGVDFPALLHPRKLFSLFTGGDVTLAEFDSGPLSLGFDMSESFGPVYAPPPVMVVISGGASVTLHVKAGFDTYGIRKAVESGKPDLQILDSLYFVTVDDSGQPLPVVSFSGYLAAGAEVSVVIVSAGVQGGISLTVDFTWNDPTNDGKFRFNEFLATALNNPICLFNVGGQLSLFIKVYITIGISPFSVSFDFTLVDITLLDFSVSPDCTPPPPRLAGTDDADSSVLYLFAGNLGGPHDSVTARPRGDKAWDANGADETWIVRQQGNQVAVQALGITQTFGTGSAPIKTVVLDGRGYDGKLKVLFQGKDKDSPFTDKAVVFGGSKDDTVKTGAGPSFIDGGDGADVISTGDRPVVTVATDNAKAVTVAGDGGADHISVGNENDTVAGDGSINYSTTSKTLHTFDPSDSSKKYDVDIDTVSLSDLSLKGTAEGSDGNDVLALGLGSNHAYGGGGNDSIAVATDSPLVGTTDAAKLADQSILKSAGNYIVGNGGSDSISGGSNKDIIYTGNEGTFDQDSDGSGDKYDANNPLDRTKSDVNTVDTGTGNDVVWGSNSTDFVTGRSKPGEQDTIYGLGGNDVLVGADGTDKIYGGRGNDYVVAQPSTVDTGANLTDQLGGGVYRITPTADANPAVSKTLVGGGGQDRIYGGGGDSTIYGDHDTFFDGSANVEDRCASPGPDRSDPPAEHPKDASNESDPFNRDDKDLILGGKGVDTVQSGGGDDWVFTYGNNDLVCAEGGNDRVYGGDDLDTVFGGSGDDTLQGDGEADHLYGNDGDDTVYGNAGADLIEGNKGADTLFGGEDNDEIYGGTTTAGRNDAAATPVGETSARGDIIRGDTGADVIIGDNGDNAAANGPVFDLGSSDASLGGPDLIFGGDDADHIYGGLDSDTIHGGTSTDTLEGNPGKDYIYGEDGADDIIGGSHQTPGDPAAKDAAGYPDTGDVISGGQADDVITGDNASITDIDAGASGGDSVMKGRGLSKERHVVLFDLGYAPAAANSGGDVITGDADPDVIYGQGAVDDIHGNDGTDYIEGGQAGDLLAGDAGQDDIVGGSSYAESGVDQATAGQLDGGDVITGGDDADAVLGDNGLLTRDPALAVSPITQGRANIDGAGTMTGRSIQPYDLGDSPTAGTSGNDDIQGNGGCDAILGQGGNDRIKGNDDGDYAEGGPGRDWIEGNAGDDDLVGGSSTVLGTEAGDATQGQPDDGDVVFGGAGDDVVLGDNAITDRVSTPSPYLNRVGSQGVFETQRSLRLLDLSWSNGYLGAPTRAVFGGDQLSGGGGVDVIFGQDGNDAISGGAADDYAEGNGGIDTIYGDRTLAEAGVALPAVTWPGTASGPAELGDTSAPFGQDDLIGGSSLAKFRDTNDFVHGDGGADFILGDNGTAVRDIVDSVGKPVALGDDLSTVSLPLTNRIYAKRYDAGNLPNGPAFVRHGVGTASTRFCTTELSTCEPTLAAGNDSLWGGGGSDTMYGQDGNDLMYGDTGATAKADDGSIDDHSQPDDDDMYGELGDDRMWGEAGDDAMLGDRGGIVDVFQNGSNKVVVDNNDVPQIHYEGLQAGSVTRQADLQHDVNGDAFAAAPTDAAMPHRGDLEGGNDRMRGGDDHDSIHAGFGDDLANGDSGGDIVFGDDGADVLWGGKGCDQAIDATKAECQTNGVFDPAARGVNDRMLDYINGGKGAVSGPSVDPTSGDLGSDIIDWHPRGTYSQPGTSTTCTDKPWPVSTGKGKNVVSIDPCSWFEMTALDDGDVANNQHHQGIDWMYGGWDRDVLQGDVADNGPNPGDRLLDWTGAYNLYTHCNAAYGGFNDVRQWSPSMQSFLQVWGWTLGAGAAKTDITTAGTSAYDELALVYQSDLQAHGSGYDFPATPGHFDNPNACAP